ncbi:MAG: GntR family transcriptional regulator [Thermomicrobiales bacterium]
MISRETPLPLYYQIELRLREAIEQGRYRLGDRLPTEGELQQAYGVSRVTVRTALRRLEEDGLISTQRGRGTYVTTQAHPEDQIERNPSRLLSFEEDVQRQAGPPRVEVLAVEHGPAPQRMAAVLELGPGEEVTRVRRLGWVGDAPLWLESRYFHPSVGEALAERDLESASVTALLETVAGRHVTSSRLRISAAAATSDQAKLLGLHAGDPVLINEFAVYAEGRAVEAARAIFRADRYAFTVEVLSTEASVDLALRASGEGTGALSLIRQEVSA